MVPVARDWRPQLICISAGYDAHSEDPLAECELDDRAYWDMAATMRELATELEAPLLICLEGGYALGALSRSVVATLDACGDDAPPRDAPDELAASYRSRLVRYWPGLEA
jgi:acetoin utilization deacetylase AcuC-like enzyme